MVANKVFRLTEYPTLDNLGLSFTPLGMATEIWETKVKGAEFGPKSTKQI